jgi:hypothetical protein
MIAVLVTFSQTDKFDRSKVAKVADDSRGMFDGMPGLRFKCFTLEDDGVRERNFYLWDDEAKARAFFTDELVERVAERYGVAPAIEYLDVVGFVDNSRA